MTNFNFYDYLTLKDNQVLKMKITGHDEWFFVRRVSQSVLQSYQPTDTPITKINLEVIKDIDLYKHDKDENNYYETRGEPEEVEQYELIEI